MLLLLLVTIRMPSKRADVNRALLPNSTREQINQSQHTRHSKQHILTNQLTNKPTNKQNTSTITTLLHNNAYTRMFCSQYCHLIDLRRTKADGKFQKFVSSCILLSWLVLIHNLVPILESLLLFFCLCCMYIESCICLMIPSSSSSHTIDRVMLNRQLFAAFDIA